MNLADIDILIHRRLSGEASETDNRQLDDWLQEDARHQTHYEQVRQLWENAAEVDFTLDPRTNEEWDKLQARIAAQPSGATVRRLPRRTWLTAVAAVLVVGLLALWLLFLQSPAALLLVETYEVPAGEQRTITLADGSRVTLNAGSFLGVVEGFNQNERRLELRGEGYFEVTSGPERPFVVQTGPVQTRVVGTAFNLRAYADGSSIQLSVTEGTVLFSEPDSGQSATVMAGNAAVYQKTTQRLQTTSFDPRTAAWRNGMIVFNDRPLAEVFRTLERHYAVTIIDQKGVGERRYTSTFDNLPLDSVLGILQQTFDLEVRREGDRIILE